MAIKDAVVGLYVKHYIIPRAQILDSPGFVVFNVSGKTPIFARQTIVPELLFLLLEERLVKKFGDAAREKLYSIGKRFGYRFSIMGNFSQFDGLSGKKVASYIEMINKFIEGTYATNISCDVDAKSKTVRYSAKNFVVSSKLGYGYFLPLGAVSGMISYILDDVSLEGIQTASQGSGSENCKIICGPPQELEKETGLKAFHETNLKGLEIDPQYVSMNQVRPTENSTYSFSQFIDTGTFSFNNGFVKGKEQRYFIFEISGLHMLEQELCKDQGMKQILLDASYEVGKKIASDFSDDLSEKFMMDLFTSFGWGDVMVFEKKGKLIINAKYAPWTKFSSDIDFVLLRSLLSGFISVLRNKKTDFVTKEKEFSQGYLDLLFEEK